MKEIKLFIDLVRLNRRHKRMQKDLQRIGNKIQLIENLMVEHGIVQKPF
jgi:hypothetical protein